MEFKSKTGHIIKSLQQTYTGLIFESDIHVSPASPKYRS